MSSITASSLKLLTQKFFQTLTTNSGEKADGQVLSISHARHTHLAQIYIRKK